MRNPPTWVVALGLSTLLGDFERVEARLRVEAIRKLILFESLIELVDGCGDYELGRVDS